MTCRVAVTGMGVVCPLGNDAVTYWRRLLAGESGVSYIEGFPTDKLRSDICAAVKGFDPAHHLTKKEAEIHGRVTQLNLAAATEAIGSAGLGGLYRPPERLGRRPLPEAPPPDIEPSRIGCLVSTGQGPVDVFEEQVEKSRTRGPRAVSPFFIPGVMPNSSAALISLRFGLMGPSYSLASACATGTHSIATSVMMVQAGEADVMLAGGGEAATRLNTVAGFGNARALASAPDGHPSRASRPFDVDRRGFVMGEGAGVLVLEREDHARARGAVPLAYVTGYGMTSDAVHLTSPHADGAGLRMAIERALRRAGVGPGDIGYINPHATSTKQGDVAEINALSAVFGERLRAVPMSATKSLIGHCLGGAGAIETIAAVCSLRDQRLHPSLNVDRLDPDFPIDVVTGGPREVDVRYALKISAGFGGHNCALVLERA